jgi:outer membrane protein TolC
MILNPITLFAWVCSWVAESNPQEFKDITMAVSRSRLLLLAGLMCFSVTLSAQTITQDQFLNQLRETHPLFQKEQLRSQIEADERDSYLGSQDWNVQSSLFYSHEEPAIAIAGPERTDAFSLSGGVERLFWNTGGRFSASLSASRAKLKIDPMFGIPNTIYENKLALTYVHPLMRNKKGALDRLQYDVEEFDIDLSEVLATENQEDFLASSASRFLDWVLLSEQKLIIQERLRLSEEQLGNTREKRDAHLIDEVDVIRAEDAVRISRQSLLMVESQWKALQAELSVLAQDEAYYDLAPEFDIYETVSLPSLDKAEAQLRQDSRLVKALSIRMEQLSYVLKGFGETEKPNLSLIAQLNLKNAEDDLGNSLALDKPDALIGLQLDFPIENRTATSKTGQTNLQMLQLEKQIEEVILELESAAANLHTQVVELENVLELNREQIESAGRKTTEEQKLYNQGRGQLTFVIQSRDSEQGAKLTYASNALMYHKLLLQYRALLDQLY